MNSLTELLREHSTVLKELGEEARQLASSVERADRERLERAIRLIYQNRGLRKPRAIIWFSSPLDLISMILICQNRAHLPHTRGFEVPGVNKHDDSGFDLRYFSHTPIVRCLAEQGLPRKIGNGLFTITFESAMLDELTGFLQSGGWLSLWPFILDTFISDLCGYGRLVPTHARSRYQDFLASSLFQNTIEMVESVMTKKLREDADRKSYTGDYPPSWSQLKLSRCLHSPLHDAFHLLMADACRLVGMNVPDGTEHFWEAVKAGGWWCAFKKFVLVCDNPVELHLNAQVRLHNEHGPALSFEDGYKICALNNLILPEFVINNRYSVSDIDAELNLEVRRIMIERMGLNKYIEGGGGREVHRDGYGILYTKEMPYEEPITTVRVRNSTAEPDGSHKTYFLRVPNEVKTAREAIAWTFGLNEQDYEPDVES